LNVKNLPPYDTALQRILDSVQQLPSEMVDVRQASGRYLAADVTAPGDMPGRPLSAVDGFAVQADVAPDFLVVGEVRAGHPAGFTLRPGQAAAIMTGSVVPEGADCVVKVEDCELKVDRLRTPRSLRPGALINPVGDEIRKGGVIACCGERLSPLTRAALSAAGICEVAVGRLPRIGLLVSGDEVSPEGSPPGEGQTRDINGAVLCGLCQALGLPDPEVRRVQDEEDATRQALAELMATCHLVVTSGGVSLGRYDLVGHVLRSRPFTKILHGAAIKPGRPVHVVAGPDGVPVMGLPGYPASFLTTVLVLLLPALRRLQGARQVRPGWFSARLEEDTRFRPDRTCFNRAILRSDPGGWLARDPGSQRASHFLNFSRCNGLLRLPEDAAADEGEVRILPAGCPVQALDFARELSGL
jgi:molybdopterin molybdotransferase